MQTTLIQRYLGNKSPMTGDIVKLVDEIARPGDLVCDAFSGSLAVSAALRASGYEVACNDINHFSWLYARAYFSANTLPWPNGVRSGNGVSKRSVWAKVLAELLDGYPSDFPANAKRTDIFDHYCEEGPKSAFTSKRGTSGRRRFFSSDNARLIDRALNKIRFRYRSGQIDEQTRCILTATLLNAVEKVSNTQGTYHDFPREFIDERALRPLRLIVPAEEVFDGPVSRFVGRAEDSLEFIRGVPKHQVLYLDPPYNFRQYTSYYFMLNLLSSHAEIDDLDGFFTDVEFVRGQNMSTDFKSSFCQREEFIPSLTTLIERADCDFVILSYFDGRNHWGQFKDATSETTGRRLIEGMFSSELFTSGSLKCVPVERKNYQSYGGYTAKPIQEFLFVAQKSRGLVQNPLRETERGLDKPRTSRKRAGVAGGDSRKPIRPRTAA